MAENLRILVVDDEKDIVQAYVDILSPAPVGTVKKSSRGAPAPSAAAEPQYEILKAYSGEEAVSVIKAQLAAGTPVAGAFFDVKMDGALDGIQAAKAAFDLDPRIQVTIVTAYQDRSVQDIDSLFGPAVKDQWDYLNKPFNSGEIVQKARHMTAAWNRREELKRTQDLLVQSERMAAIGQVARGVGHEFGNILQRIVGRADIAVGASDQAKMKEALEVILQAAENAAVIVQNLQAFSRKESQKKATDIAKVITDALTLLHHDLHKASIKVENKLTAVPAVNGSVVELGQVFVNLLINAMHAIGGKGGTVEVGTRLEAGKVVAWVKDSGTGIPADVLPRIFDYAFTTKGDKGSGLGLSISKQIIEGHGGTMAVQSAPGQGALFTVSIPAGGKAS